MKILKRLGLFILFIALFFLAPLSPISWILTGKGYPFIWFQWVMKEIDESY
jgi:hypothetical protein